MILAFVIFVFLATMFGLTYYLNSKTPVPKGCENDSRNCEGCVINSCIYRKKDM